MDTSNANKIATLQRVLERAKAFDGKDTFWSYDMAKTALMEAASLLPPEMALLVMNIVGNIDKAHGANLERGDMTNDDAVAWCLEHCVQITFDDDVVSIIDPFIVPGAQTPITAKTFVDAVAKAIRQCK